MRCVSHPPIPLFKRSLLRLLLPLVLVSQLVVNIRESNGPWRGPLSRNLCRIMGCIYVAFFLVSWWAFCDRSTAAGDEGFLDWCRFDERAFKYVCYAQT